MLTDALKFFCRHLIGIGWYEGYVNAHGEFTKKPTFYGASGFLLQFYEDLPDSLCLITAGHVFTDYQERKTKENYKAKDCNLFDQWGPNSTCTKPIPFNIFESDVLSVCDEANGRDFALVPLPYLLRQLFSQTTTPFTRSDWIYQHRVDFDWYAMLGLPNEEAKQITGKQKNRKVITTFQNPILLCLEPCPLPEDIPSAANPQFIGRIRNQPLESIQGMSGGPIFGFKNNPDGQPKYWPVAIQSRWLRQRRIVIGTLISSVALEIEQKIEMILNKIPPI